MSAIFADGAKVERVFAEGFYTEGPAEGPGRPDLFLRHHANIPDPAHGGRKHLGLQSRHERDRPCPIPQWDGLRDQIRCRRLAYGHRRRRRFRLPLRHPHRIWPAAAAISLLASVMAAPSMLPMIWSSIGRAISTSQIGDISAMNQSSSSRVLRRLQQIDPDGTVQLIPWRTCPSPTASTCRPTQRILYVVEHDIRILDRRHGAVLQRAIRARHAHFGRRPRRRRRG